MKQETNINQSNITRNILITFIVCCLIGGMILLLIGSYILLKAFSLFIGA